MIRIPFNKPPLFPDLVIKAVKEAWDAGKLSGDGLNTQKCTDFFKTQFGYDHSLLTPSCTAALEMAALLLNLGPGDEVIVPSFTFVTSANAFALRGVNLVFADSEEESPNVSVSDILKKVTEKTKAIVVVHYAGVPVDVHRILKETSGKISIVEDCAHAIGSIDPKTGDQIGKAGCLATFSFHETKNIGIGEGGLLVVNDERLWNRAQIIREKGTNRVDFREGRTNFYTWISLGSSYLMSDIDAGMLWGTVQKFEVIQEKRLEIWDTYDKELVSNSIFKKPNSNLRANAHMYYLEFKDAELRQDFCKAMKDEGILVATHYLPLDTSPFILEQKSAGLHKQEICNQAAAWSANLVRLPLFYDLTEDQLSTVIDAVNHFAKNKGITLALATENHWESIRQLRNDNRECFWHTDIIEKEEHWNFMREHHSTYRVVIQDNKCIGFIGHVHNDVRLATSVKGNGVSQFMWSAFVQEFPDIDIKVKRDNKRSLAFFKKLRYYPDDKAWLEGQDPVLLTKVQPADSLG